MGTAPRVFPLRQAPANFECRIAKVDRGRTRKGFMSQIWVVFLCLGPDTAGKQIASRLGFGRIEPGLRVSSGLETVSGCG